MIGLILIIVGILLALIDMIVPTRPAWVLNVGVILIGLGVLLNPTTLNT